MTEPLAGPTLVGLARFRLWVQLKPGPQQLLLTGLARPPKRFHRSGEPGLIFPHDIEVHRGIAHTLGRFNPRLGGLVTPGEPAIGKFFHAFERGSLVFPELDAQRPIGFQSPSRLQEIRKQRHVIAHDYPPFGFRPTPTQIAVQVRTGCSISHSRNKDSAPGLSCCQSYYNDDPITTSDAI